MILQGFFPCFVVYRLPLFKQYFHGENSVKSSHFYDLLHMQVDFFTPEVDFSHRPFFCSLSHPAPISPCPSRLPSPRSLFPHAIVTFFSNPSSYFLWIPVFPMRDTCSGDCASVSRLHFGQFRVYLSGTNEHNVRPAFNRSKSEALRFEGRPIISAVRVCRLDRLEIVR